MATKAGMSKWLRFGEIAYWIAVFFFLASIFKIDYGVQVVRALNAFGLASFVDGIATIPYVAIVARAKPGVSGAAEFTISLYVFAIVAHFILAAISFPRLGRAGPCLIHENDSYERYMLRHVYLFKPALNIVSLLESIRSMFGAAPDQVKNPGPIYSNDLLTLAGIPGQVAGRVVLLAVAFVVLPLFPGGFDGRLFSLPFSFYAGLMVLLQANALFELALLLCAFLRRRQPESN